MKMFIDPQQAEQGLPSIVKGVEKYLFLQKKLFLCDVSLDEDFQKAYNGFYRVRQRSAAFYRDYFLILEKCKTTPMAFHDVLSFLYTAHHRVEASFASKLIATVQPDQPVWDSIVLKNLNISAPSYACKQRLEKTVDTYQTLCKWYQQYLSTAEAQKIISIFDRYYPNLPITPTKKIDFTLWSIRENH